MKSLYAFPKTQQSIFFSLVHAKNENIENSDIDLLVVLDAFILMGICAQKIIKTNPEKETNATKYFFIKTVTFQVAVFVFCDKTKIPLSEK